VSSHVSITLTPSIIPFPKTAKQPPFARAYSASTEEHTTQTSSIRLASKVLFEPRGCTHEQAGPLELSLDHKTSYHFQPRLSRLARTSAPIKSPCRAKHNLPVSNKETLLTHSHALRLSISLSLRYPLHIPEVTLAGCTPHYLTEEFIRHIGLELPKLVLPVPVHLVLLARSAPLLAVCRTPCAPPRWLL